jgi:flagellar hook protein FlgE
MDVAAIALSGLQSAQARVESAGRQLIAATSPEAPTDTVDLSAAMVELMTSKRSFEANIKVMQTADQMSGQVLDLLA